MDEPGLNECTLIIFDKTIHVWREPASKHLGKQLSKAVYQADWSKITDRGSILFLSQKNHISLVHQVEAPTIKRPDCLKGAHDVLFNHLHAVL